MINVQMSLGNTPKVANGCHTMSGNVKVYIKDGLKHRLNGPAELDPRGGGKETWFKEGKKHRIGGPAVIYTAHPESNEYWVEGKRVPAPKSNKTNKK